MILFSSSSSLPIQIVWLLSCVFMFGYCKDDEIKDEMKRCQLFMAESTIPNAGLGMYTGGAISTLEDIFGAEIVIQIADFPLHSDLRRKFYKTEDDNTFYWLPKEYYWDSRNSRGWYDSWDQTDSMIPGLGMLANSHMGLINAHIKSPPAIDSNTSWKEGAFSSFYDFRYVAPVDVPAGGELFVNYGDEWFSEREWKFGPIPLSHDFKQADSILNDYRELMNKDDDDNDDDDLWHLIHQKLTTDTRMKMALPESYSNKQGENSNFSAARLSAPHQAKRSIEWLQQNGKCLDHIRPDASTIPKAGRGTFATRFLSQGAIVTSTPLVHVHRHHNEMYHQQDDKVVRVGTQLFENYCYGHANSSLLFFPYSPTINFINHHSDESKINAKLQWSETMMDFTEWANKPVGDILSKDHPVLMLDFIALRDIEEGEEIFINYGENWQQSWEHHKKHWKSPTSYIDAEEYNDNDQLVRTVSENPYPHNVMTICYLPKYKWLDLDREDTPEAFNWEHGNNLMRYMDNARPCDIIERDEASNSLYTAKVKLSEEDESLSVLVRHIPRYAIEFVNRPYSSHQYFKGAFRHEIEIPDDIFPSAWLDLADDKSEGTIKTSIESLSDTKLDDLNNNDKELNEFANEETTCWLPKNILLEVKEDSNEDALGDGVLWYEDEFSMQHKPCVILSKELEFPELAYSIIQSKSIYTVKVNEAGKSRLIQKVPRHVIRS